MFLCPLTFVIASAWTLCAALALTGIGTLAIIPAMTALLALAGGVIVSAGTWTYLYLQAYEGLVRATHIALLLAAVAAVGAAVAVLGGRVGPELALLAVYPVFIAPAHLLVDRQLSGRVFAAARAR